MPNVELPHIDFKAVILGDTNVGKTSLVLRLTEGYYREKSRSPTVAASFLTKRIQTSSGVTAKVQIWDTAGQAPFRKMAPIYWKSSAAILICYDVSNVQSWEVALQWLKDLRSDKNVIDNNIVLTLVATKSDLFNEYYCDKYDYGNSMVSMAQVDQALKAMNYNVVKTITSSNHGGDGITTPSTPTTPQSYFGGNGGDVQIMHVHTSARIDDNVDLLFQKITEEVLYVREQERSLWMNYGIKYKHYSSATTSNYPLSGGGEMKNNIDFVQNTNAMDHTTGIGSTSEMSPSGFHGNKSIYPSTIDNNDIGVQALSSPHYSQFQNNKENMYDSPSMMSRKSIGLRDSYNFHRNDTNEILKFPRSSREKVCNSNSNNKGPIGDGLCYGVGCTSEEDQSSSCIIS